MTSRRAQHGGSLRPGPGGHTRVGPGMTPVATPLVAAILDGLVVAAFALAGRRSHAEAMTVAGWWSTAWPFLAALAIGWVIVSLTRRHPATVRSGILIWLITLAGGMGLRTTVGQGTAAPFVAVAAGVLLLGLLGWRLLATVLRRRSGG